MEYSQMSKPISDQIGKTMPATQALGALIAAANPYTKAFGDDRTTMHFVAPDLNKGLATAKEVSFTDIHMEEDSRYPAEWVFKGQPQKIHKALRIQYRYPKRGENGEWYMVTDYLLIGFEGSGGGQ
jgi:hypothetical protein